MSDSPTLIVVGGGPVGVAAAIACANRGFAVTVVEKAAEKAKAS